MIPTAAKIDAGIYTLTLTSETGVEVIDVSVKVIGEDFLFFCHIYLEAFIYLFRGCQWSRKDVACAASCFH